LSDFAQKNNKHGQNKAYNIKMKSYIHVYTGNGKGKTTAAFGLALRAIGAGKKVFFAQFIKGKMYAEIKAVQKHLAAITIKQYGFGCFIVNKPTQEDIIAARNGLEQIAHIVQSDAYDMVVLDEADIAIYYDLFTSQELIDIIQNRKETIEIIITGRHATPDIIEIADLVTEMKEVKHYYTHGVEARKGIEY
jgi:cob(I)alamin adenosyltransferase